MSGVDAITFLQVIFKLFLLGIALVGVIGLALLISGKRSSDKSKKSKARWIPPWEDVEEIAHWSQSLLNELEWKRFEQVISHYFKLRGFRSKVTRMGADGGVDVVLYEEQSQDPHTLIQCKSWS